jgi:tetratricopeptide (TPR) repeat protein
MIRPMRFLAAIAIVLLFGGIASADKEGKARADKLFEDGRKYLTAKEYALACTAFEQSHAADPAIGTQLNIALCYEEWGKLASAYRAFLEAERLAKEKKDKRAAGARKKVDDLAERSPKLVFDLPDNADPSTVLLFDDKQLDLAKLQDDLLVDPGTHTLEIRVPDRPVKKQEIEAVVGERKRIPIELPVVEAPKIELPPNVVISTPRRKGRLYGGIALSVGGAAAIGIASIVALAARQDYANAVDACPGGMCTTREAYDATQDARFKANMMTFVAGGGVVLVGVGVYLIVTSAGKRVEQPGVSVRPLASPNTIGLAIGGSL